MNIKDFLRGDVYNCERFEPRNHFISRWSMIVRVNVVLNRTFVDSDWRFDNLCGREVYGFSLFPIAEAVNRKKTMKSFRVK